MHENSIYTFIYGVYECVKRENMMEKGAWRGDLRKNRFACWHGKQLVPLF